MNDTKKNKPSIFKRALAIILIMAIGYGIGFGTLTIIRLLQDHNKKSIINQTNSTECTADNDINHPAVDKPIIYFYPTEEIDVNVKLGHDYLLTCSYPVYNNGWDITAKPDGSLIHNGQDLYALYYEAKLNETVKTTQTGFVVKNADTIKFLEEKLTLMGLNYKERQEFIVYWLPLLQKNDYNYIYFATGEEVERQMPLTVSPAPDTTIRIWMYYEGLTTPFETNEQDLPVVERHGFTVVEWGGSEITS